MNNGGQLAQVSVKNHKHGALNPYSHHQRNSLWKSTWLADDSDPLTLYQCAPTRWVAALVLCAEDIAQKYSSKPKVKMAGAALCSQVYVPDDRRVFMLHDQSEP